MGARIKRSVMIDLAKGHLPGFRESAATFIYFVVDWAFITRVHGGKLITCPIEVNR